MTTPSEASAPILGERIAFAVLASGIGIAVGWSFGASHQLDTFLALFMPVAAATTCIELLRKGSDRKLWAVPVLIGAPLALLLMNPHRPVQTFAGIAGWLAIALACASRRRRVALWCVVLCSVVLATRAL